MINGEEAEKEAKEISVNSDDGSCHISPPFWIAIHNDILHSHKCHNKESSFTISWSLHESHVCLYPSVIPCPCAWWRVSRWWWQHRRNCIENCQCNARAVEARMSWTFSIRYCCACLDFSISPYTCLHETIAALLDFQIQSCHLSCCRRYINVFSLDRCRLA